MKIDSLQYVKPAIAYFQELVSLASEKGFIMSRVNARELSNRLSDIINNDFISPILKVNACFIQLQSNNFSHTISNCAKICSFISSFFNDFVT